ncbi:MAG: alpha-ketoacid dehydrogenase subunit alpha/beta [Flavobacteriaceae bacterium]
MRYAKKKLSQSQLRNLYRALLWPRMIEEKMLVLLRQGQISKWFSGIGQEAIAVGVTEALQEGEYILPLHRNLGVFTSRQVPLHRLFSQWQGKAGGFTQGRDRSFHFGSQAHQIIGMISHLGPQLGVACGIALSHKLARQKKVCVVFTGEGGTSEGDFHEALNLASVWKLPVIFCVENNGYGLSTPTKEQFTVDSLTQRAAGYNMESLPLDGNNILEVYHEISALAASIRKKARPVLVEFKTFRQRGHEEASGTAYVPEAVQQKWRAKDPVVNYEDYLLNNGSIDPNWIDQVRAEITTHLQSEWEKARSEESIQSTSTKELSDIFQHIEIKTTQEKNIKKDIRFIDAIKLALDQAMARHSQLVLMGQDIAGYGGVFKATEGLMETYGKKRVRNTPLCESVVISCAYGYALTGRKAVVEMQFADFVSTGFTAVVNLLAKSYYRWGQPADVVIRMPCGGGVQAGPFHSQSNEAWFTTVPGLKVVYPAFPNEAKGLLLAAIDDPNPVLFFEHKKLYRSTTGSVDLEPHQMLFGKGVCRKEGAQLSIVTYGLGVHWALEVAAEMPNQSIEIIDLNTLVPWDREMVFESVRKTNRVLLLQEDSQFGGYMGEIAAQIAEDCFEYLDAPVGRLGALDTPIPFARALEDQYLPVGRLKEKIAQLLAY